MARRLFTMLIDNQTARILTRLAEEQDRSQAAVVRQLIRQAGHAFESGHFEGSILEQPARAIQAGGNEH